MEEIHKMHRQMPSFWQFDIDDLGSKLGFVDIEKVINLSLLQPQGVVVMAKWIIYMTVLGKLILNTI